MKCIYCKNEAIIKFGIVKGQQRYKCNKCNRTFRPKEKVIAREDISTAIQLYCEGISSRWIKKFSSKDIELSTINKWLEGLDKRIKRNRKNKDGLMFFAEDENDLKYKITSILLSHSSKLESGVLIIGMDIGNPFSCQIRINPNQSDY